MTNSKSLQGTRIRATHVASALFAGLLALSATLVVPVIAPTHAPAQPGGSVHAKNAATPGWIVERQAQNAHQMPVAIETDEPSFWI